MQETNTAFQQKPLSVFCTLTTFPKVGTVDEHRSPDQIERPPRRLREPPCPGRPNVGRQPSACLAREECFRGMLDLMHGPDIHE